MSRDSVCYVFDLSCYKGLVKIVTHWVKTNWKEVLVASKSQMLNLSLVWNSVTCPKMAESLSFKCLLLMEQEFQDLKNAVIDNYEGIKGSTDSSDKNISPHNQVIADVVESKDLVCFHLIWCFRLDMTWSKVNISPTKKNPCYDNIAAIHLWKHQTAFEYCNLCWSWEVYLEVIQSSSASKS